MQFVIWGGVLLLLPVLLYTFVSLTPHSEEFRSKGFGGRWNRSETLAFLLLLLLAGTKGWVLIGPWMIGLFLLASGVAQVAHFSLPFTLLCEGIAILVNLLSIFVWLRRTNSSSSTQASVEVPLPTPPHIPLSQAVPPHITTSSAPPALLFHTAYSSSMLTVTVHAYRKRRAFRPIPKRFDTGWKEQGQAETWFVELDCTFKNSASNEIYVWGQLEEVLLDGVKPHVPRTLRQFPQILSDDDSGDIAPGSNPALAHAKHSVIVKDLAESKMFFKLDKSMKLQKMAFSLHPSDTKQGPYKGQPPLFTIDV